jgi:cephalosporin hydroxylase
MRPGPLFWIEKFLAHDKRFEIDTTKTNRFLLTHHPKGWVRRL